MFVLRLYHKKRISLANWMEKRMCGDYNPFNRNEIRLVSHAHHKRVIQCHQIFSVFIPWTWDWISPAPMTHGRTGDNQILGSWSRWEGSTIPLKVFSIWPQECACWVSHSDGPSSLRLAFCLVLHWWCYHFQQDTTTPRKESSSSFWAITTVGIAFAPW